MLLSSNNKHSLKNKNRRKWSNFMISNKSNLCFQWKQRFSLKIYKIENYSFAWIITISSYMIRYYCTQRFQWVRFFFLLVVYFPFSFGIVWFFHLIDTMNMDLFVYMLRMTMLCAFDYHHSKIFLWMILIVYSIDNSQFAGLTLKLTSEIGFLHKHSFNISNILWEYDRRK